MNSPDGHAFLCAMILICLVFPMRTVRQRANSADGKKRSFLTVRWNDLLGGQLFRTH
jgi:hypothetical protein